MTSNVITYVYLLEHSRLHCFHCPDSFVDHLDYTTSIEEVFEKGLLIWCEKSIYYGDRSLQSKYKKYYIKHVPAISGPFFFITCTRMTFIQIRMS